jgi:hypothetical protein
VNFLRRKVIEVVRRRKEGKIEEEEVGQRLLCNHSNTARKGQFARSADSELIRDRFVKMLRALMRKSNLCMKVPKRFYGHHSLGL